MVNWLKKQKFKKNSCNELGLSLTEMVVTVLILGILAAIAIPIYSEQTKTAVKAQVKTDVGSTAQMLAQWQERQSKYNSDPTVSVFNGKIVIRSDADTKITYKMYTPPVGSRNTGAQFCVQGEKRIGSENFVVNYSLTTKVQSDGPCPASVVWQTEEVYD